MSCYNKNVCKPHGETQLELINVYAFEVNLKSDYFDWLPRQSNRSVTYYRKHLALVVVMVAPSPFKLE